MATGKRRGNDLKVSRDHRLNGQMLAPIRFVLHLSSFARDKH